ncbi:MAG TPA: hypothetical protein DEO84_00180 [candidate division Zixibacteria bacterium]|nr:hypothetical protein [candidate division Zixibacteria bacterium]HBY99713.1 hypothetical protein [candidate division Zixibacteria bacterium]
MGASVAVLVFKYLPEGVRRHLISKTAENFPSQRSIQLSFINLNNRKKTGFLITLLKEPA